MSEKQVLKLGGALLSSMPENFTFKGSLDLTGSLLHELPRGLIISDDLIINDANINSIPNDCIIGGNVIDPFHNITTIAQNTIIQGSILTNSGSYEHYSSNNKYIILNNGKRFYYKKKKFIDRRAKEEYEPDAVSITWYLDYFQRSAVSFTIFDKTYGILCDDLHDAVYQADYYLALARGLEKYRGIDIDTPIPGEQLFEIFSTIVNPCLKGPQDFLTEMDLTLENSLSIRELSYKIIEYKKTHRISSGFFVWLNFFNIEEKDIQKRD